MAQLFPRWSNTAYRLVLATIALGAFGGAVLPMVYVRTAYGTHQTEALEQPIEFDHRHHVRDNGIACAYCHTGAEDSARAGLPATATCMGCHNQIWTESELLAPVRASLLNGQPIVWRRVYTLPDFVYFHHGVHVQADIPCGRCHGDVANMARVYRAAPLTMEWCLDCHRHPPGQSDPGYALTSLTTCTACHR